MRSLNKDQLTLLNGSSDVELMSLEDMYDISGGSDAVPATQSCPYGTIPNGVTFYVPRCTQFGHCQPVLYKVCTPPGNPK